MVPICSLLAIVVGFIILDSIMVIRKADLVGHLILFVECMVNFSKFYVWMCQNGEGCCHSG